MMMMMTLRMVQLEGQERATSARANNKRELASI